MPIPDSDDFARDQADFVGCAAKAAQAAQWCPPNRWITSPARPQGRAGGAYLRHRPGQAHHQRHRRRPGRRR